MKEKPMGSLSHYVRNCSLLVKFFFILSFFLLPIGILTYSLFQKQQFFITTSKNELITTEYLSKLRLSLEGVLKHQYLMNSYLQGNKSLKNDIIELQGQINSELKELQAVDFQYEEILKTRLQDFQNRNMTNLKPSELERIWSQLDREVFNFSLEESEAKHKKLIGDIVALSKYVGDTGALNLDHEHEVSYLVDTTTNLIPQTNALLMDLIVTIQNLPVEGTLSDELRSKLIVKTSQLEERINQSEFDLSLALHEGAEERQRRYIESKLKQPFADYSEAVDELILWVRRKLVNPNGQLRIQHDDFVLLANNALDASFVFFDDLLEEINLTVQNRASYYRREQIFFLSLTALFVFFGTFFAYFFMRKTAGDLCLMGAALDQIGEGNLNVRMEKKEEDEIGQLVGKFNLAAESLQQLIGQLQWAGIQLSTTSTEITQTAKHQEASVYHQEATTRQIAQTAKEISKTSKGFAITMGEVSNASEQTSALATAGRASLGQMEAIMHQMVEASQNIAAKLSVLNEKAGTITSVITTIAKVADQTNLLSLNAAIEAEKAGEHGRSFSVIAREIRRLADQTANATLDIEKMVTEMVSAVSAGVMGVDKFSEEIHAGVKHVSTVNEQLTKIIEQVQQQTENFENVNQGMQAQSLSAEEINESISQLIESSQRTSESIRQFHQGIDKLNLASEQMESAVSKIHQ